MWSRCRVRAVPRPWPESPPSQVKTVALLAFPTAFCRSPGRSEAQLPQSGRYTELPVDQRKVWQARRAENPVVKSKVVQYEVHWGALSDGCLLEIERLNCERIQRARVDVRRRKS